MHAITAMVATFISIGVSLTWATWYDSRLQRQIDDLKRELEEMKKTKE